MAARMVVCRPMRLSTILFGVSTRLSPLRMEAAMCAPIYREPSPTAVYGPM